MRRFLARAGRRVAALGVALAAACTGEETATRKPGYPPSPVIAGIAFDPGTIETRAPGSDNWPITWAGDGNQYTCWGDGGGFGGTGARGRVSLGVARVEGSARDYAGYNRWGGFDPEYPARFEGKCYGILGLDGLLFMWRTGARSNASAFEFQALYRSDDLGGSWAETGVRFTAPDAGGRSFFAPTFLQFGRDHAGARDEHVYVYAPEVTSGRWNVQRPGRIALLRVPRGELASRERYEFFAGLDDSGTPRWTRDMAGREAVFSDPENGVMRTSVSYNAGLSRYLLITQQVDRSRKGNGHIGIYDAPEPWGPWTTVLFANPWKIGLQSGEKTVFWNFSNKWLADGGRDFVLVYTGPGADEWGTIEGRFRLHGPER